MILRKFQLHQILGQLSLWLVRSKNTMRPKHSQLYVVILLVTTLRKFQIPVTVFAHSTPPVCMIGTKPAKFGQAADMVRIAPYCWYY